MRIGSPEPRQCFVTFLYYTIYRHNMLNMIRITSVVNIIHYQKTMSSIDALAIP